MYVCKYAYAPIFRGRLLADRRRASVPPCSQQLKLITREQLATGNWQHTGRPATPTPTIRIIQQQQQRRKAKQEKAKAKTKKNPHTNKSKKKAATPAERQRQRTPTFHQQQQQQQMLQHQQQRGQQKQPPLNSQVLGLWPRQKAAWEIHISYTHQQGAYGTEYDGFRIV